MSGIENERYYPDPPEKVYAALLAAARRCRFKVKGADEYAKAVTLSTPASGFSWGATMSVYVMPREAGSVVSVGGTAKVRTNITAKSSEYKNTIKLLDAVSAELQAAK